ncbi:MAG: DUF481 domain-containing protein [Candidatus Hydrogenedentota bacterium]
MLRLIILVSVILSSFITQHALADTITLKNGDRLSGTLLNISSGIVSFRTKLAGRIMVPSDQLASLSTEGFLVLALQDNTALPGRIETIDSAFVVIAPNGESQTTIDLAQVQQVESLPESAFVNNESDSPTHIAVTTGYKLRTGTKDASGPTARLNVDHDGAKVNAQFEANIEYTEDADAMDRYFDAELIISKQTRGELSPTLIVGLERNRDKALKLGTEVAAGVSKTLYENEQQLLSGFAGVGGRVEDYDPQQLRDDLGASNNLPGTLGSEQEEELILDLRLRYTRHVLSQSVLHEQFTVQPSLKDTAELHAELESSLTVPIILNMRLNFNLLFDYDSEPFHSSLDKWNTSISAGLQIEF